MTFLIKNNWIRFGLIISVGLVSACSNTPPKSQINVQAGEYFTLKQAIQIPAGKVKSYIQFGKVSGGSFSRFDQHCRIELYALSNTATPIEPQRFLIERVAIDEESIAQKPLGIQLATNQYSGIQTDILPISLTAFGENQREETMDLVHMYLKSDRQPNVYRLTCAGALSNGNPLDAPRSYRPQREQINRILGATGSVAP